MWREPGVRYHQRGNAAGDIVKIEWFGDHLLAPGVQCGEDCCAHMVGSHCQDRHFLKRWVGAQPRGDFPAIKAGHTEVQQNERRPALASKANRFVAVGSLNDGKPKVAEEKPHNRTDIDRIVGDQNGGA
jgi:hypothetical protein